MKQDVNLILNGPHTCDKKFYILCALSDLHSLMKQCLTDETCDKTSSGFAKAFPDVSQFSDVTFEKKSKLRLHMKKLEYYLSYAKDCLEC